MERTLSKESPFKVGGGELIVTSELQSICTLPASFQQGAVKGLVTRIGSARCKSSASRKGLSFLVDTGQWRP